MLLSVCVRKHSLVVMIVMSGRKNCLDSRVVLRCVPFWVKTCCYYAIVPCFLSIDFLPFILIVLETETPISQVFVSLHAAIKDLNKQLVHYAGNVGKLKSPWSKKIEGFKEPYICSYLQNLPLFLPGTVFVSFGFGNLQFYLFHLSSRVLLFLYWDV